MNGAGLGGSVEAEVWELLDADDTAADETIDLVAAALQGDEELADHLGGDAPTPMRPHAQPDDEPPPLRAFLLSITVEGFRGIGPRATLELNPYCGITVISGRNGSGKSSFAEALEYALTGTSYRWTNKKAQHWETSWRNLHAGGTAAITVDFAMEPDDERSGSAVDIGVEWDAGSRTPRRPTLVADQRPEACAGRRARLEPGLDNASTAHVLRRTRRDLRGGTVRALRCAQPAARPDEVSAADGRLKEAEKRLGGPRKAATEARTRLRQFLDGITDPRAAQVKKLTAKAPYDLATITPTTLGTGTDQAATIARLRAITALGVPDTPKAAEVANELRAAIDAAASCIVDGALVAQTCYAKPWTCAPTPETGSARCVRPGRSTPHGAQLRKHDSRKPMRTPPSTGL